VIYAFLAIYLILATILLLALCAAAARGDRR